jgi:DNA-binding NtrC family response regulator
MTETPALLVVDDEAVVCHVCQRIFARRGFRVEVSPDPRTGLSWAAERRYAVILLDIKMPLLDGVRLNAETAKRFGACEYVPKPFTVEEICTAVQRALAARHMVGR